MAWTKRLLLLPNLVRAEYRRSRLQLLGAEIGDLTSISPSSFDGSLSYLRIGHHTTIGRVHFQLQASVVIGNNVCINDGVRIFSASHDVRSSAWAQVAAPVLVEDFAWIASGSILLPGITIGRGAVVGAGAVVSRNVPRYAVATGNPIQIRENVRCRELHYSPEAFLASRRAWLGSSPQ